MDAIRKVLLFLVVVFLFFSLSKNIFDYRKTISFYNSFKKDYEKEKKENITLKTTVLKNNDLNELEKTIRNKLNLLKDNEVAVIIPHPTPTPEPPKKVVLPIYQLWFNLFFRK